MEKLKLFFSINFSTSSRLTRREFAPRFIYTLVALLLMLFISKYNYLTTPLLKTIYVIVAIPLLWHTVAQYGKRLHDIGFSAWWVLIGIIPYVSWIFAGWVLFAKGEMRDNKYGFNPRTFYESLMASIGQGGQIKNKEIIDDDFSDIDAYENWLSKSEKDTSSKSKDDECNNGLRV